MKFEIKQRNPWAHLAEEEHQRAAAFADRVVLVVCIILALWIIAEYIAPDIAAWIHGGPVVMVSK